MKKVLLFLFLLLCAFSFLGCTSKESEESDPSSFKDLPSQTGSTDRLTQEATARPVQFSSESIQNKLIDLGIAVVKEKRESIDFELEDLGGNLRKLSSFQGKVVFLNFWATWCGPCRIEMPSMQRLYDKLKNEGLEIVAVDLQESKKQVKKFMGRYNLSFTVLLDKNGEVGMIYGARSIPMTYLIDRDGYVFAGAIGAREWDSPQTVSIFREILQNGVAYSETSGIEERKVELTGETKELTIEAYSWGFRKSPVTLRKGDKVRIVVKSTKGTHGLAIPAFNVSSEPVNEGNEEVIEFVATEAGQIMFGCNVPCGRGHESMRDTLEIVE
jgi:thiol-disulfide isomerase/thioredoxin/plastocyanin